MTLPLSGLLVVSLEQAVAAPMCTCRLADVGARVIKIERPEGDFARDYDHLVHGESAHFVWLNRGKQSVVLDLTQPEDRRVVGRVPFADGMPRDVYEDADGRLACHERAQRDQGQRGYHHAEEMDPVQPQPQLQTGLPRPCF